MGKVGVDPQRYSWSKSYRGPRCKMMMSRAQHKFSNTFRGQNHPVGFGFLRCRLCFRRLIKTVRAALMNIGIVDTILGMCTGRGQGSPRSNIMDTMAKNIGNDDCLMAEIFMERVSRIGMIYIHSQSLESLPSTASKTRKTHRKRCLAQEDLVFSLCIKSNRHSSVAGAMRKLGNGTNLGLTSGVLSTLGLSSLRRGSSASAAASSQPGGGARQAAERLVEERDRLYVELKVRACYPRPFVLRYLPSRCPL